jgi:titin
MVAGDWTLTPIAGGFTFDIDVAPSNGGSAITGYEYSTNNGSSWAALSGGAALGTRDVTGLSVISYSCRVRAVNAIGAAPDPGSDTKTGTPLAGGATYIEFATLSGMTAGGAPGATRTYTGSAADGTAGGPNWNLPTGTAGRFAVEVTQGGATPVAGLYTTVSGAWDANIQMVAYASGANWVAEGPGFTPNLVTTPRTFVAGDSVRLGYSDTGNTYLIEIARAADPTTWLVLGTGTLTRSGTTYPRLSSFGAAGAVFTAPRVSP